MDMSNEEIVRRYSKLVYRIAMSQMGNQSDADDVYQDVFLQLMRYINRIKDEEHLKYWLIRATVNRCKKQFLSSWWRKTIAFTPEMVADKEELPSELYFLVQNLSPKYRSVIHLHYYEEYTVEEIAEILKIKEGTVKSRLFRARKTLEKQLEE